MTDKMTQYCMKNAQIIPQVSLLTAGMLELTLEKRQELNVADEFVAPLILLDVYPLDPDCSRLSAPFFCTYIPSHILVHAL